MSRAPQSTRLVGRAPELGSLHAALREAADGASSCRLITGDPGIGKTRLVQEFLDRNRNRALALTARGYPLGETNPFGLWVEAFEGHLRQLQPAAILSLCGGLVDDVAAILHSAAAVRGSAPGPQPPRPRLLAAMATLCANLARQQPVIFFLDDLHHADASSLELLSYLVRNLRRYRILFIGAARPGELRNSAAGELVLRLEQDGLLMRMEVTRLDPQQLRELVRALLKLNDPPDALLAWLEERSLGNPLFATGLLRALAEAPVDLSRPQMAQLPEDLIGRVQERVDRLDPATLEVVDLLTVHGHRVTLGGLTAIAGREEDVLLEALDQLIGLRLVTEGGGEHSPSYEISHPLVQEALYEWMPTGRRRRMHREIGRSLLQAGRLLAAAPHFARSAALGDDEAADVLCRALRHTQEREAAVEAMAILRDLVDVLAPEDQRWLEVLRFLSWHSEWMVDHKFETGELSVERAISAAAEVADKTGDVGVQARVWFCRGAFLAWDLGDLESAESAAQRARELFEQAGLAPERRLADDQLAWISGLSGDLGGQESRGRGLLAEAETAGDDAALIHALNNVGFALYHQGKYAEAETILRRGVSTAEQSDLFHRHCTFLAVLAQSLACEGRLKEALATLDRGRQLASAYPDTLLLDMGARIRWMTGDYRGAIALVDEAVSLCRGVPGMRRAWAVAVGALAALESDRLEEAQGFIDLCARTYGSRHWYTASYHYPWARGMLAWRRGQAQAAFAGLDEAADGLRRMGALAIHCLVEIDRAQVAAELGDQDRAAASAMSLRAVAESVQRPLPLALANLAAGYADLTAKPDHAVRSATEALTWLEGSGYRPYEARALEVLGRARKAQSRAGRDQLRAAARIYEECGAVWRLRRLASLLGGVTNHPAVNAAVLSGREREVAAFTVQGLTAGDIAARLHIGRRTVETHLANCYTKLGVRSKVELAARAGELDLQLP
jgi:DNA-binding CsgD family transcriptional regulator